MSVVKAEIQTVEDMYRLIWMAVANRQPIRAIYKELPRLFSPHRLGRNRLGEPRVLCYQHGGESESGLGPIRSRARTILKVVIERGLCRSGRTRRATRPEVWGRFGRW